MAGEARRPISLLLPALAGVQLLGWASTYYLPAILAPSIARDFGLPLETVFIVSTLFSGAMAVASPALAGVLTRRGARPVLTLGAALLALALAAISAAETVTALFAAWIALGVGGALALGAPAYTALAEVRGPGARQAISALMLVTGLSSTVAFPTLAALEGALGWRGAVLLLAGAQLLIAAPIVWRLVPPLRHSPQAPPSLAETPTVPQSPAVPGTPSTPPPAAPQAPSAGVLASPPLDRRLFLLFALAFSCSTFVTVGFEITRVEAFRALGLEEALAIAAASAVGVAQVASRAAEAAFGRRVRAILLALAAVLVAPVSVALLGVGGAALWSVIAFVALYGASTGLLAVLRATLPLELFPAGRYGAAAARATLPFSLAAAIAPPLFARALAEGGVDAALALAVGGFFCAAVAMSLLFAAQKARLAA